MKNDKVCVAILDDHQSIIDGYQYRLALESKIEVVAVARYGNELEAIISNHHVDVLLMDIRVPISSSNLNPYPFLHVVSNLVKSHPNLNILVISMLTQSLLIETLVDAGVSGYIYKGDNESIQDLAQVVLTVANGGIYLSDAVYRKLRDEKSTTDGPLLSPRQLEALSLCAAYPDRLLSDLAALLGVAGSTMRNLLSNAYLHLDVRTRQAAVARAQQMGLIPNNTADQDI